MVAALLSLAATSRAWSASVETKDLVVSSTVATLSTDRLKTMADQAQTMLERVVAFWSADSRIDRFGKIQVIFDLSDRGDYYSVFYWEGTGEGRRRVVRVFGFDQAPQQMAHKLASAVFPQKDKLIRNMMGILTESQVGNRLAFPLCGFDSDDWVSASLNAKSYLPLAKLGSDHESWGMRFSGRGGVQVFDRAKQHTAYAEAGSFAAYLFRRYGVHKLTRLQQVSQHQARPFQDVFGAPVEELEAHWLAALRESEATRKDSVATVATLTARDPITACREARRLAASRR
jgi:hypothetical protein